MTAVSGVMSLHWLLLAVACSTLSDMIVGCRIVSVTGVEALRSLPTVVLIVISFPYSTFNGMVVGCGMSPCNPCYVYISALAVVAHHRKLNSPNARWNVLSWTAIPEHVNMALVAAKDPRRPLQGPTLLIAVLQIPACQYMVKVTAAETTRLYDKCNAEVARVSLFSERQSVHRGLNPCPKSTRLHTTGRLVG